MILQNLFVYKKKKTDLKKKVQVGAGTRKVYDDESVFALGPSHSKFSLLCLLVNILRVKYR